MNIYRYIHVHVFQDKIQATLRMNVPIKFISKYTHSHTNTINKFSRKIFFSPHV